MRSKHSDDLQASRRASVVRPVAMLAAALLFVIPQNYVALTPSWQTVAQVATALGALAALVHLTRSSRSATVLVVLAAAFFAMIALFQGGEPWATPYMMAAFAVGLAAWPSMAAPSRILALFWVLLLFLAASVAIDGISGAPQVAGVFGDVFRVTGMTETRPRGLLGQPVPTAVATSVLTTAVVRLSALVVNGAARRTSFGAAILIGASTIVATGTRSALLILLLGLILNAFRSRADNARNNALISLVALALIGATALWAWPRVQKDFSQLRALSFESLAGSDSAENRRYALSILDSWVASCDLQCKLVGAGARDLQYQLANFIGYNGLTTVDNLYVTLLWDFGLIGLMLFFIPALIAVRRFFSPRSPVAFAATSVLLIYVSGFFFDTLYTVPFVVMLGFLTAPLLRPEARRIVPIDHSERTLTLGGMR